MVLKVCTLLCAGALSAAAGGDTVLYNNYSGNSYANTGAGGVSLPGGEDCGSLYDSFTPSDTESLAALSMVLYGDAAGSSGTLQIGLFKDDNTSPGALIETIVDTPSGQLPGATIFDDPDFAPYRAYNLTLTAQPIVDAGTRYWIGFTTPDVTGGCWAWIPSPPSSPGVAGEYFYNGQDPFVHSNAGAPYEMELIGDPVNSAPEPWSFGLTVFGATVLLRRRLSTRLQRG